MRKSLQFHLLFLTIVASAANAFSAQVERVEATAEKDQVRIEVELSTAVTPIIRAVNNPSRLIVDFPNASLRELPHRIVLNQNGVGEVRVGINYATPLSARITVSFDSAHPYGVQVTGNKVVLTVLPHPGTVSTSAKSDAGAGDGAQAAPPPENVSSSLAPTSVKPLPEVDHLLVESTVAVPDSELPSQVRSSFKVKYVAGNTVYIDGGSNSGLRDGMTLEIHSNAPRSSNGDFQTDSNAATATVRVIGVAATSAITELSTADGEVVVGDRADLKLQDARNAAQNALTANPAVKPLSVPDEEETDNPSSSAGVESNHLRSAGRESDQVGTRMAGRVGLDFSSVTSTGSTQGSSRQVGISLESDMTHILGTNWNLQGYWRGRLNHHSQFQDEAIDESLNKTYTMQLSYDNPNSKWVAGAGRLYLPWAVSLDTIDGIYWGRKTALGMTSGMFAGSTPDLSSWDYQPDHRIAGSFVNFTGGDYEKLHYSSTSGLALSSIKWKIDRPFAFFENQLSYGNKFSLYHSLDADQPRGISTNGIRPGTGISHSYFTAHYRPARFASFDLYHNYFRNVPTAATTIVGTGLVDKLLFQGISGGVHLKPIPFVTLYSTLGASEKTGDLHRSINQMYGATWSEISHSGLRADVRYTKFDSSFGSGNYRVLSLSRQFARSMFWNVMLGKQDLLSSFSTNYSSRYIADSVDVNIGRHSYLQSGYTYVQGATLNYREWYMSSGLRLDKGKSRPEYVQTLNPTH